MQWDNLKDNVVTLAKSSTGMVQRCGCEGYHINIQHVTLHLSREGLKGLADLIWKANEREMQIQGLSFLSFTSEE